MSHYSLHKNINTNFKSDESAFDEYLYCDKCHEFVYEYCSIHGPYLVIPDDKVSSKPKYPSFVPRAALTIPSVFLHLAPSRIPGAGLGVFSTLTVPRGVRFGPYRGRRADQIRSMYCWQIFDNNKPSHVVDAADANSSNWMRYVNCARHWCEQNLVAYQYKGQVYYRTVNTIPPFAELLVFYGTEYASYLKIDLRTYNSNYQERSSTPIPNEAEKNSKLEENKLPEALETTKNNNIDCIENVLSNINKENNFDRSFPEQNVNETFEQSGPSQVEEIKKMTIPWSCQYCNRALSRKTNLLKHYATHKIKFTCKLCPYKTNIENEFTKHVERHSQAAFVCDICSFLANNIANLRHHRRRMHKICTKKLQA